MEQAATDQLVARRQVEEALCSAGLWGSGVMPDTPGVSEAYRGSRIQPRLAEGKPVCTARIGKCSIRPALPVVEAREDRVRQSYTNREAELVRYGDSGDCDGCNAAQLGAEAKPHSEGCWERVRQAVISFDMGQ